MQPITIDFRTPQPVRFSEQMKDYTLCSMEAFISCKATMTDSVSGRFGEPYSGKKEFMMMMSAVINKCISEMPVKIGSVLENIDDGKALIKPILEEFAKTGDTVIIEDIKFEVTEASLDNYERVKSGGAPNISLMYPPNVFVGAAVTNQSIDPKMLVGMAVAGQIINQTLDQPLAFCCRKCGAKRENNVRFCTKCGAKF